MSDSGLPTIESLMDGLDVSVDRASGLETVFSTRFYAESREQPTYALFDLDPDGDSPLGAFVRVDVDVLQADAEPLLIIYLPEPFAVRLPSPCEDVRRMDDDGKEVAIVLEKAMLYLRFSTARVLDVFMRRVLNEAFAASEELTPSAPPAHAFVNASKKARRP